jgi:hypothetical protein
MKNYIRKCVEKKVADKLAAAEKAKEDQAEKDSKAIKAVEDYAKSLIPDATKKVVAFAKKQGLTWLERKPSRYDFHRDANIVFSVNVDSYDFEETNPHECNTSAARNPRREIAAAPGRINKAVNEAVDAIVFSLELGKVKKAELEELIASTEVEL